MKMELKEKFEKLMQNNSKQDWNDIIFRATMKNAFLYCADNHIYDNYLDKQKVFDAISNELSVGHGKKAIRILEELRL